MLAVIFGAFGAHLLKKRLTADLLDIYHTAVQYHFFHSLALLGLGLLLLQLPESVLLRWSGWLLLAGMILFSGSLYMLALSGMRWLGAITPLGGGAFIIAWLLLAVAVWKAP